MGSRRSGKSKQCFHRYAICWWWPSALKWVILSISQYADCKCLWHIISCTCLNKECLLGQCHPMIVRPVVMLLLIFIHKHCPGKPKTQGSVLCFNHRSFVAFKLHVCIIQDVVHGFKRWYRFEIFVDVYSKITFNRGTWKRTSVEMLPSRPFLSISILCLWMRPVQKHTENCTGTVCTSPKPGHMDR